MPVAEILLGKRLGEHGRVGSGELAAQFFTVDGLGHGVLLIGLGAR